VEAELLSYAGCAPASAPRSPRAGHADKIDGYLRHCYLPNLANGRPTVVTGDANAQNINWLRERYGAGTIIEPHNRRRVVAAIEKQFREVFLHRAVSELAEHEPQFSASTIMTRSQALVFSILGAAILLAAIVMPHLASLALSIALAVLFAANAMFRAFLLWTGDGFAETAPHGAPLPDEELPVYSLLIPLYREANVLPSLIEAMKRLDYPPDKLDVLLVVEADDCATFDAAQPVLADDRFSIIRVPEGGPRTKPRACNYAFRGVPFCAEFREAG